MANEEQITELEVLKSIYEGDPCFHIVNDTTFQYKFGDDGEKTSFLLEIQWPPDYPEVVPSFNLNAFYNNHVSSAAKNVMIGALDEQAVKNVGDAQVYTIIEWAKDSMPDVVVPLEALIAPLSLRLDDDEDSEVRSKESNVPMSEAKTKQKKEQLTKSQKRREWNRMDNKGEKPRGYDWVDVIKHLSQTGGSQYVPPAAVPTTTGQTTTEAADDSD